VTPPRPASPSPTPPRSGRSSSSTLLVAAARRRRAAGLRRPRLLFAAVARCGVAAGGLCRATRAPCRTTLARSDAPGPSTPELFPRQRRDGPRPAGRSRGSRRAVCAEVGRCVAQRIGKRRTRDVSLAFQVSWLQAWRTPPWSWPTPRLSWVAPGSPRVSLLQDEKSSLSSQILAIVDNKTPTPLSNHLAGGGATFYATGLTASTLPRTVVGFCAALPSGKSQCAPERRGS
jgi:hypothetical protein